MYNLETLIVVTNFQSFVGSWGATCTPVLNNGNYILPLGWEAELKDNGITYEVKEVSVFTDLV